jgi:hypothetical protein
MSHYRKIDPRIWNDSKFRCLSDDGKLSFLFVLTHPHMTALGAMRATLDGLAAELGWPAKRFRTAIQPAVEAGLIDTNESAAYLALPNFLRYNEPEGPNSVKKAWINALDYIPECSEKSALIDRCRTYLDKKGPDFKKLVGDAIWDAFPDAIDDAMRDPCPIQEQEQEPKQEQEQKDPPGAAPRASSLKRTLPRNGDGSPERLGQAGVAAERNAVAVYCEAFRALYGENPRVTGQDASALKGLLRDLGSDVYEHLIARYFAARTDPSVTSARHPVAFLRARLNGLLAKSTTPGRQPGRQQISVGEWKNEKTGDVA